MIEIKPEKAVVIIPTYNENDNIASLLSEIWHEIPQIHILVIDDNSLDGTAKTVKSIQSKHSHHLHLIQRSGKLGLGTAYVLGFQWAIDHHYDAIISMDADFSHNPSTLPVILQELATNPFVIGSRYVEGGGTENWSLLRKAISKFGSFYARNILGMKTRDLTGGFNGMRREVLQKIDITKLKCEGYAFQIELKYRTFKAGFSIKETPILFSERRAGQSKMSFAIMLEAMIRVWGLRNRI